MTVPDFNAVRPGVALAPRTDTLHTATNTFFDHTTDTQDNTPCKSRLPIMNFEATGNSGVATTNSETVPSEPLNFTARDIAQESAQEDPSKKNPSSWDPMDDILLRHLKEVKKMGWKEIAQYFVNRTPNACQFRWRRLKSGNLKSNRTALVDVTEFPGEIKILNPMANVASDSDSTPTVSNRKRKTTTTKKTGPVQTDKYALPSVPGGNNGFMPPVANAANSQQFTPLAPLNPQTIPTDGYPMCVPGHYNLPASQVQSFFSPRNSVVMAPGPEESQSFAKPRSYSHSTVKPLHSFPMNHVPNHINTTGIVEAEGDNVGYVPKVFVKSRRASAIPPVITPESSMLSSQSFTNALNTTLNSTKSRKNSVVNGWSRRSSFNVNSSTSSRRSSIIIAPNSLSNSFSNGQLHKPSSKQRRESVIKPHKQTAPNMSSHNLFPNSYSFVDMPDRVQGQTQAASWSIEEDQLLQENRTRNLSLSELSVLLPKRSDMDIQFRINVLKSQEAVSSSSNSPSPPSTAQQHQKTPLHQSEYLSPSQSPRRSLILDHAADNAIDDDEETVFEVDEDYRRKTCDLSTNRSASSQSSKDISPTTFSNEDTNSVSSTVTSQGGNVKIQDYSHIIGAPRRSMHENNHNMQLPSINTILQSMR
ncbi:Dot6p KNAG_0C03670 [Huiozyma naganishii CBS 8797]|uniref:Myb-like domain-containing protein n=1 Tax=Huiozyma naganishii (strain ATCC MYA-139 / BCRC 22969 / CBS 8797 / KCTC 17520 / NBRC 10181 / NCYC 3082 / Yp74L-3) TaxID=1071383 RepID=J7S623_HUIN7|nr:hypothetical protein KNAG_0C03670 [Kazachstania naganishii CBS 8797]CCK69471.1 hypothetical protein KNAG_0C03670 [Kazachstania naganishii CBS 8797]